MSQLPQSTQAKILNALVEEWAALRGDAYDVRFGEEDWSRYRFQDGKTGVVRVASIEEFDQLSDNGTMKVLVQVYIKSDDGPYPPQDLLDRIRFDSVMVMRKLLYQRFRNADKDLLIRGAKQTNRPVYDLNGVGFNGMVLTLDLTL